MEAWKQVGDESLDNEPNPAPIRQPPTTPIDSPRVRMNSSLSARSIFC